MATQDSPQNVEKRGCRLGASAPSCNNFSDFRLLMSLHEVPASVNSGVSASSSNSKNTVLEVPRRHLGGYKFA